MKTYDKVKAFKQKFGGTVSWRLKKHCSVIDKHINPNEELLYAFLHIFYFQMKILPIK